MDKRSLFFVFALTFAFFGIQTWFNPTPPAKEVAVSKEIAEVPKQLVAQVAPAVVNTNETFYVLETPYQQLVFSNIGGAITEINLPLQSEKNPQSVVREIDIDRQILKTSPENSYFPLNEALTSDKTTAKRSLGGYYPLIRRSIVNASGTKQTIVPPESYAFNIVSDDSTSARSKWNMTRFESNLIQFQLQDGIRKVTKTFSIPQEKNGPYCFDLEITVDGPTNGLWLTSGVPDVELVGGAYSPLLRYQLTKPSGNEVDEMSLPKKGPVISSQPINWLSNCNGFLGVITDGIFQKIDGYKAISFEGTTVPTRLSLIDAANRLYPAADYPGYATLAALKSNTPLHFRVFAGPYDDALLKKLDDMYKDPAKGYFPDYADAQSISGWFSFISQPFSKLLFFLMQIFYTITRSWAASIILLTIALRAMMYPLNAWSIKSAAKMQEIAPRIKAVQEKYKKDPKKAQMETMLLYRDAKVNPFTGCLPMLLQMPFLIGMFYLLKSSFPLRGAPFIPGWIDDLAAPDVLFSWGQSFWLIGNQFHLLPILMGVVMYLQQRYTSKLPKDSANLTESQKQQKMMGNMMAILFTVMFYNMPSGLNLYFMSSTLLGVLQQWWMTKSKKERVIA